MSNWIERYVGNPKNVITHSFSPFIHRKAKTRKFRKEICHDGTRSSLRKPSFKPRDLYYANHVDSNIYSYYANLLSSHYETKLTTANIEDCVTAYRKVKLIPDNDNSRNKCNVDFANDVFNYIKANPTDQIAITFDIKSFFDNLNHHKLKRAWRNVVPEFSDDHYSVFRNITKFSFVEENELFDFFKEKICVERQPKVVKEKSVSKKFHLRNQRAIAFCKKEEIANIRAQGLIKSNKYEFNTLTTARELRIKGIPQGSPISSVLANIYLFEFDQWANNLLLDINGIYRRYSDDMVIICPKTETKKLIELFVSKIKEFDLAIQDTKTQVFEFHYSDATKRHYCFEKNENTKKLLTTTKFEYLGFQFDGKYVMLKNSSLASYYRKMKRSFARGHFYATYNKTPTKGELFKGRLYKRFTHLGSTRRRIYKRDKRQTDRFTLSYRYDWGNYLTYANLASGTFEHNKISQQIRKHWNKFHELMNKNKRRNQ